MSHTRHYAQSPFEKDDPRNLLYWFGPGWYFWDECLLDLYGPYETEVTALSTEEQYFKAL